MSMNYTPTERDPLMAASAETDSPMFAPTPAWDRSKNRRKGAFTRTTETVTTSTVAGDPLLSDGPAFAATPRAVVVRPKSGLSPLAIGAGIVVLGGLAVGGWYASQQHATSGVAQLTPGSTSTSTTTAVTPGLLAEAAPPPEVIRTAPATTTTKVTTTSVRALAPMSTTHKVTRVARAAPARSATAAAVDTSARTPAAPQPYSGTAQPPAAVSPPAATFNFTPPAPAAATPEAATTEPPVTAVTPQSPN